MPDMYDEYDHSDSPEPPGMILVMGVTGSGKSHFINKLAEGTVQEGPGLKSQTQRPEVVKALIGDDDGSQTEVAIVDTPGFDDTLRPDSEILAEISQFLALQYLYGIELKGIVYLHRITDNKMQGSAFRYFQMFKNLCGEHAFRNVVLLTTMWDQLKDKGIGYQRDQELRADYWKIMEDKGSQISRFDGTHEMAESIILRLLGKQPVTLDIQRELVDEQERLEDTAAGRLIASSLDEKISEVSLEAAFYERELANTSYRRRDSEERELVRSREKAKEEVGVQQRRRDKLRKRIGWETKEKVEGVDGEVAKKPGRDKISMFVSFLGLTINLVFAILPLVGVL